LNYTPVTFHTHNKLIDINFLENRIETVAYLIDVEMSDKFKNLIIGTACVESDLGSNLGDGRYDIGVFQINRLTLRDLKCRVLPRHVKAKQLHDNYVRKYGKQAIGILEYQILLVIVYYMDKIDFDFNDDIWSLAYVWKIKYNTVKGAGTTTDFYNKYNKYFQ